MNKELEEALESIEVIRNLEDNWNNNGAKQFSEKLIDKVTDLVKELTPVPEVFPTACNSIQLEWESEGSYVELEVFEDRIKMYTTALDRLDIKPLTIEEKLKQLKDLSNLLTKDEANDLDKYIKEQRGEINDI